MFDHLIDSIGRLTQAFELAGLKPPVALLVRGGELRQIEYILHAGGLATRAREPGTVQTKLSELTVYDLPIRELPSVIAADLAAILNCPWMLNPMDPEA